MRIYKFVYFFLNYLKLNDWLKIVVNYLLVFFTIIFEILFIYLFFIIINKNDNLENQEKFINKIFLFFNNFLKLDLYNINNQIFFFMSFTFYKKYFSIVPKLFF